MKTPTILLIGADGAAQYLLSRGFAVRVLARDPGSDAAGHLRHLGAEVVPGDLSDRASLRSALRGIYGVFGLTTEPGHGRNLINAVAGAEVEHFVFSTSQHGLELYAESLGLPVTFVEPSGAAELLAPRISTIFENPDHHIGERVVA